MVELDCTCNVFFFFFFFTLDIFVEKFAKIILFLYLKDKKERSIFNNNNYTTNNLNIDDN
jgi:hypothetical protein